MREVALYKFCGNFMQDGKWSEPEIGFRGEFIAFRDGTIYGYCDELYDTEDEYKKRFIVGRFIQDGISFAKLSNSSAILPIIYSCRELKSPKEGLAENALWQSFMIVEPIFFCWGEELEIVLTEDPNPAKLSVERVRYSEKREMKIRRRTLECNLDYCVNEILFNNPEICKFLKEVKETEEDEVYMDEEDRPLWPWPFKESFAIN